MSIECGRWRVRRGQVVVVQVSLTAALAGGGHPAVVVAAAGLMAVTFARPGGRWLPEWLRAATGLWVRRGRAWMAGAPATVPALSWPGITVVRDDPPTVLADRYGTSAVLDIGPTLTGSLRPAPPPALDVADLATAGLPASVRLLVYGIPAPAGGDPPAASYQELTGGGAVTVGRVLLVIRAPSGGDLAVAVRAVRRRLAPVPSHPLDPAGWQEVLDDLGCGPPVREGWSGVSAGGSRHVAYRIVGPAGTLTHLLPDLLRLPAGVIAVAPHTDGAVTLRTALDPASGGSGAVDAALAQRLAGGPARVRRLDGEHLPALAATSPLPDPYVVAGDGVARMPLTPAGLMLGNDEGGAAVLLPLTGRRSLRVVLAGPLAWGHLLAWRGLGAGARVVVRTARPRSWQPVVRAAGRRQPLLLPPEGPLALGAGLRQPVLLLDDSGVSTGWLASPTAVGHTQVVLRERIAVADVGPLTHADLVLAPSLDERSATLASAALGLGQRGAQLRAGTPGTLTVVNGGTTRQVQVGLTRAEQAVTGISIVESGQKGPWLGERESIRHGSIRAWESS